MIKVTLIDSMGTDLTVVNAARVSMNEERVIFTKSDIKLINFLAKHNHWTPFAHCFITFRIKSPIFVARQLVKHQVGLAWNEVSRRYVKLDPEFYIPKDGWRMMGDSIKQGSLQDVFLENMHWDGSGIKTPINRIVENYYAKGRVLYTQLLANGVCPEQARMVLPLALMTEWIWSGSLMAFARICQLRSAPDTQKETRDIADEINDIVTELYPISWEALCKNG